MNIESGTMDNLTDPGTETEHNAQASAKTAPVWRKWLPAGVIAAVLAIFWFMGWLDYISLSSLIQHRETLGAFVSENLILGMLAYIALYAGLVAISFPGASFLTVAAGFLFGGLTGAFVTVIGATIGAVIIFQIATTSLGDAMQKRAGKFAEKMRKGFQEDSFLYVLTLRFTPVVPFWVMNIVPAILGMRVGPYALATFLGIIPGTLAFAYIGSGLDSVIMAQEEANPGCSAAGNCEIDPSSLITTDVVIAMVGLGLISILPVIVKKLRKKPL